MDHYRLDCRCPPPQDGIPRIGRRANVRISAGLPLVFTPVRIAKSKTGREHLIVDGGVLSNCPVWVANALEGTNRPILGLRLTKDERPAGTRRRGLRATFGFISSVARTTVEAHDRSRPDDLGHTRGIDIPPLGVGTAEFDLPRERKLALYEAGRAAAARFLATWDTTVQIAERHAERFLPWPYDQRLSLLRNRPVDRYGGRATAGRASDDPRRFPEVPRGVPVLAFNARRPALAVTRSPSSP